MSTKRHCCKCGAEIDISNVSQPYMVVYARCIDRSPNAQPQQWKDVTLYACSMRCADWTEDYTKNMKGWQFVTVHLFYWWNTSDNTSDHENPFE